MQRIVLVALAGAFGMTAASAQPMPISPSHYNPNAQVAAPGGPAMQPTQVRYGQPDLGGGFIEALFGGGRQPRYQQAPGYQQQQPLYREAPAYQQGPLYHEAPGYQPAMRQGEPPLPMHVHGGDPAVMARPAVDPRYFKQVVTYTGKEKPGTLIIDTPTRHLYLVQDGGKAIRYGIGVGRPGFTWAGVKQVSQKREWPDWRPPEEMLRRRPDLPTYMAGGPQNPLGARALYLGSSLYRIHGSNEPWTIGQAVSSGCIRMRNEDVIDLYDRVKVGTKVVVI